MLEQERKLLMIKDKNKSRQSLDKGFPVEYNKE